MPSRSGTRARNKRRASPVRSNSSERYHGSIDLPRPVYECIRQISHDEDVTMNLLYAQAIDLLFEDLGKPSIKKLTKGKVDVWDGRRHL